MEGLLSPIYNFQGLPGVHLILVNWKEKKSIVESHEGGLHGPPQEVVLITSSHIPLARTPITWSHLIARVPEHVISGWEVMSL